MPSPYNIMSLLSRAKRGVSTLGGEIGAAILLNNLVTHCVTQTDGSGAEYLAISLWRNERNGFPYDMMIDIGYDMNDMMEGAEE